MDSMCWHQEQVLAVASGSTRRTADWLAIVTERLHRLCALQRYRLTGAAPFSAERPICPGRSSLALRPPSNNPPVWPLTAVGPGGMDPRRASTGTKLRALKAAGTSSATGSERSSAWGVRRERVGVTAGTSRARSRSWLRRTSSTPNPRRPTSRSCRGSCRSDSLQERLEFLSE